MLRPARFRYRSPGIGRGGAFTQQSEYRMRSRSRQHGACHARRSERGGSRAASAEPGRGGRGTVANHERSESGTAPQGRTSRREAAYGGADNRCYVVARVTDPKGRVQRNTRSIGPPILSSSCRITTRAFATGADTRSPRSRRLPLVYNGTTTRAEWWPSPESEREERRGPPQSESRGTSLSVGGGPGATSRAAAVPGLPRAPATEAIPKPITNQRAGA